MVQQADNGASTNTTITLVEVSTTGASQPVQSISLPGATTPNALRINGSGGTSGYLSTTNDGSLLSVMAANAQNSTDLGQAAAASITTRSVVTLNSDGVYALPTAGYIGTSGNQTRTSTSLDNTNWIIGDNAGIYLANAETTPSTAAGTGTNILGVSSFGGAVYALSASGVFSVNTSTGAVTALPGVTGLTKLTGFYLVKSGNSGSTYDVLYIVGNTSATAGTVYKYYWSGSTWTAKSTYTTTFGGLGIAAKSNSSGATATLYVTSGNGATVANKVIQLTDTASYNSNISVTTANNTTLYTFTGNNLGKGIAFTPNGPSISTVGAVSAVSTVSGTASAATSFSVIASGLTGNLTVTAPTGFEVSSTSGGASGYASTATLTPSSGTVAATTIYVRLTAADAAASYSGNITCSSSGASTVTLAMPSSQVAAATITLTGTMSALSTTYGTASSATTFSVSGSGLSGNLTVTPPTGFEVSATAGGASGYASTAILSPSGGTVSATTIYVRLTASATVSGSPYSGSVSVSGGGAVTQTNSVPSSTVSQKALTISPVSVTTKPYDGTNAATITGTLVGVLSGDTANVALTGTGTFASTNDGSGIAVTSTSTITGTAAGNYTLTQPTGLTGTILASANLGGLTLGTGVLSPAFAAGTTSYSATVSSTQTSVSLVPTQDTGATVTVNGVASTGTVSLSPGTNTFTVVVTNGSATPTTQTYTVVITVPTAFMLGNLAVETIGSSTATPITILELSPSTANQSPVNSYPVPSTGTSALRQSNAGTTGRISTTNDGTLLAFTGFQDSTGILSGATVTDETAIALRGVATLDKNFNYTLQASYDVSSHATALGDQIRTATSLDNTNWIMDDKVGMFKNNSTTASSATYGNTTNCLVVKSFGGTIYVLSAKTTNALSTLSSDAVTLTGLTGLPTDANASDFYLLSSGVHGSTFDVLYILDGATISKFSLVGSSWVQNGSATSIGGATGVGLTAASNGAGANLFVTTGASLTVLQITDTAGYDAAPAINTSNNVTLYTAPTGQFIKGVALAPTSTALPDLTVAVSGSSSPVVPGTPTFVSHGASATYYLTVANSGTVSASGVTTTFTLPTGMSGITTTTAGGFSASVSGSVVTFTGGSVAANSAVNLTVTASTVSDGGYTVDAGPTPVTAGHGTAVVSTSGTESNTANNSANVSLQVIVGHVPYINVSASGPSTAALTTTAGVTNTTLAYTLTVQNTGTAAVSGASVNFTLPAGTTYVSSSDNGSAGFTGAYSGGVVTFIGGTIASGATETLTVNLTSTTSAYRVYTVNLPAGGVTVSGGNAAGNLTSVASVSTAVSLPAGPDLTVSSTPNGPFVAGDLADTYTVYVSNGGDNVTDGSTVTVSTTFPSGLTPTAASGTGWATTVSGQTVTATRTDVLSPGAIGTNQGTSTPVYPDYPVDVTTSYPALTFTVSVGSGVTSGTQLANTVTVSGGGDAFPANGTITNTVTVGPPTALSTSGKLLVTRSHYTGNSSTLTVGQLLPNGALATADGTYPYMWTNDAPDVSFGVTSPIYMDVIDKYTGSPVSSSTLTANDLTALIKTQLGVDVTTSASSKSELGVTLTYDSKGITFMGYMAPANTLDVSNAETPYHYDPTSPLSNHGNYQHVVVQMDYQGNFKVTPIDAYSGDNTRAVTLAPSSDGNSYYYIAGSAGNGAGINGATMAMYAQSTGIQMILPGAGGLTTPVGQPFYNGSAISGTALSSFLSGGGSTKGYQLGYAGLSTDKTGKDMNLRALTLNPFNNTFYAAKGSGGSGVDTIYQIGSGGAPTAANANTQVFTILNGFPTTSDGHYPFGMWFANATTLYVADEGQANVPSPADFSAGKFTQALPANNPYAGLQKWTFDGTKWKLQYILTNGLNLGVPYTYTIANYPTGTNAATGVPWQPANNGLRNITGQVNGDGTVTIYAVTATVSGETDQGADPNQLVAITDNLAATTLPASESFIVLERADGPDAIRGVALAPASATTPDLWAALTHSGTFSQGDAIGDTVTINVYNSGNAASSGTVSAVATLPTGISPSASNVGTINGWTVAVSGQTVTATRSDSLAQGSGFTSLPLAVTVTSGAATTGLTNTVTVSGGGEVYTGNDTATDIITVVVPPVNSLAANGVTSSGANLNGSVNPNGTDTTVYFQYGTSTAYTSQSSPSDIGSGSSAVGFSANLTGLTSGTTYHYRLVTVANGVTTVYADQTFQPGSAVPAMPLWALLALAGALLGIAAMSIAREERRAA